MVARYSKRPRQRERGGVAESFITPSSLLGSRAVPDRGVTADTARCLAAGRIVPENVVDQVVTTVDAVSLQDLLAHRPQADRLRKVLKGEALGVPEAVFGLDQILGHEGVRHVAVVAGGHGMMAGVLPAVVLVAHDVAIDACPRIAA